MLLQHFTAWPCQSSADTHMRPWARALAATIGSVLNTLSVVPAGALAICVVCWTYNLIPTREAPFNPVMAPQDFLATVGGQLCCLLI